MKAMLLLPNNAETKGTVVRDDLDEAARWIAAEPLERSNGSPDQLHEIQGASNAICS